MPFLVSFNLHVQEKETVPAMCCLQSSLIEQLKVMIKKEYAEYIIALDVETLRNMKWLKLIEWYVEGLLFNEIILSYTLFCNKLWHSYLQGCKINVNSHDSI